MKKHILFPLKCLFLLLPFLVGGCRIAKNRPILTVPDKDKDRIEKTIFVGALEPKEEPKYWISQVTVVDTTFGHSSRYSMFEGSKSEAKVGYFEFTRDKLKYRNVVNRRSLDHN